MYGPTDRRNSRTSRMCGACSGSPQQNTYYIHISEHEIQTEKCSDTCQHNMIFVLTFTKTLVETYGNGIWLGHMSDLSGNCTGQHQKWLENV